MRHQADHASKQPFVPPVALIDFVLRVRRMLLRLADRMVPPYVSLLDRFMGAATTSLVHNAARLRLADLLREGPQTAEYLATKTGTRADPLERMLQALVSVNVFQRLPDGRFANNHLSSGLISGTHENIRGFSEFFGLQPLVRTWGDLSRTLQEEGNAFERVNGKSSWAWMSEDAPALAAFVEGMSSMTAALAPSIAAAYPFGEVKKVCDVGGGVGIVLAALLTRHPHLQGVLYDDPSMLAEAPRFLQPLGVLNRIELTPGNFMERVPRGADAYLLKTVVHNWDDARAIQLLKNCRAAMDPGHRLLVADFVNGPDTGGTLVPFMDITGMMVFANGRERTPEDMAQLFSQAGFQYRRLVKLPASQGVFEGVAV